MLRSQVSDPGGDTAKSYQQKAVACPLGIARKKHLEDNQAKKKRKRRSILSVRWTFIGDKQWGPKNFFLSIFQSGGTVINARERTKQGELESKNHEEGGVLCYVEVGSSGLGGSSCRNGLCSAVSQVHACERCAPAFAEKTS
jgi:hypothetical protein